MCLAACRGGTRWLSVHRAARCASRADAGVCILLYELVSRWRALTTSLRQGRQAGQEERCMKGGAPCSCGASFASKAGHLARERSAVPRTRSPRHLVLPRGASFDRPTSLSSPSSAQWRDYWARCTSPRRNASPPGQLSHALAMARAAEGAPSFSSTQGTCRAARCRPQRPCGGRGSARPPAQEGAGRAEAPGPGVAITLFSGCCVLPHPAIWRR